MTWTWGEGATDAELLDTIYEEGGCRAIAEHFNGDPPPIPTGAIDSANGKTILGWSVDCPLGTSVAHGGVMPTPSSRTIPTPFGAVTVWYAEP